MADEITVAAHDLGLREAHAQRIAQVAVRQYTSFRSMPERDVAGVLMVGYLRRIERDGVTQQEADLLLLNDLRRVSAQIRRFMFPLLRLNEVRMAVILHLAFVLGADAVKAMKALWDALRAEDYETAADVMLLSDWPTQVGRDLDERRRAVDLVRMMRTGHNKRAPK